MAGKFEAMGSQALLQRINQLRQLLWRAAGGGVHDMVVPPVARLVDAQLEAFAGNFLCRQLQCLQPVKRNIADEYQCGVQCLAAHGASAAQAFQRRLPCGQLRSLGSRWP